MKLVGYLRVSTEQQQETGFGLDVQLEAMQRWAKANGHKLVIVKSEAITGSNAIDDRVALPDALKEIEARNVDGLLVYNLDRLARTLAVQEAILGQVWALGGRVFTAESGEVLEDDPDDPMRTAMRQMRGVFSQLEKSMLLKRLRDGRRTKDGQGGYAYGAPMYGWRAEGRQLIPVPDEQAVIARMRAWRDDEDAYGLIAQRLNDQGIPTKRGGRWQAAQVSRILDPEARDRARDATARHRAIKKKNTQRKAAAQ